MPTITSEKLTHMIHNCDLYLYGDKAGGFAIKAIKEVFNALDGGSTTDIDIKLKIDGSPSALLASDFHGESFVATKGFFGKERRMAYTEEDCEKYYGHAPDLKEKMVTLLSYAQAIGVPKDQIWQGDFLYTKKDLQTLDLQGESCIAFQPNTIVYAIPKSDPLAREIKRSDMGIAWHTVYTGEDFNSLKIGFTADVENLNKVPAVFQMDSKLPSIEDEAGLSPEEEKTLGIQIKNLESDFNKAKEKGYLSFISGESNLQKYLLTYRNFIIKTKNVEEEENYLENLEQWLEASFDKEISKKKMPKTRQKYEDKKQEELQKIEDNKEALLAIISLQTESYKIKEALMEKLNNLGSFRTLVKHVDQGYLPTGQEGFAISDSEGNVQKFVSRLEFSKNNFSKEILKGWMSNARLKQSTKNILRKRVREAVESNDLKKLANEIISQLQRVSATMSKEQLVTLKNEMLSLIGEEVVVMKYLDSLMNLFPKFKKRLIPLFYEAFRSVDDDAIKTFITSALSDPIIPADIVKASKKEIIAWKVPLQNRLDSLPLDDDDKEAITHAVGKTYSIFAGGNAGMGRGEVQYALLCGGSKPERGDLLVPGFGEIEIKGTTGRMRGVQASLGDNKVPATLIKNYLKTIPGLEDISKQKAGVFSLRKRDEGNEVWRQIISKTGKDAVDIIEHIFLLWAKGSYGANFDSLHPDTSLIRDTAESIMTGDWLSAMAYQAALQYDIYKKADEFRGILFVSPTRFFFVEEPQELADAVISKKLVIAPASLSLNNNIGAAAGLNIPQK